MLLDTNVILRLITQDIPDQADQAFDAIEKSRPNSCLILDSVLVEVTFILQYHAYAMSKTDIAAALDDLFASEHVQPESADTLAALRLYAKHPKLDFVDCLLATKAGRKSQNVLTFDKALQAVLA